MSCSASASHFALGIGLDSSQPVHAGQKCCASAPKAKLLRRGDNSIFMSSFILLLPGLTFKPLSIE